MQIKTIHGEFTATLFTSPVTPLFCIFNAVINVMGVDVSVFISDFIKNRPDAEKWSSAFNYKLANDYEVVDGKLVMIVTKLTNKD